MAQNALWEEHIDRLCRLSRLTPARPATHRFSTSRGDAEAIQRREWTAAPPDGFGQRLLADIEPYLEFFVIARS